MADALTPETTATRPPGAPPAAEPEAPTVPLPESASVQASPPAPLAGRCVNDGAALAGPFCSGCGQEDKPLDPPVRFFVRDFAQELFDVDNRILRSLRRLVFSPGFLTREHVQGRRADVGVRRRRGNQCVARRVGLLERGRTAGDRRARAHDVDPADDVRAGAAVRVAGREGEQRAGRRYPAHLVFALHIQAAAFTVRRAEGLSALAPRLAKAGV